MSCSRSKEDEAFVPGKKWTCKACTYENWPRAVKCTVCCQPKNSSLIVNDQGSHKSEKDLEREERRQRERDRQRDIYRMASLYIEKKDNHQDVNLKNSIYTDNPNNKWQCPRCTYMNWPKAAKCTQCMTVWRRPSPTASVSFTDSQSRVDSPSYPEKLSAIAQARPEVHSPLGHKENEKWWAPGSYLQKWPCSACTYENWPKSSKCVLCLTTRPPQRIEDSLTEVKSIEPPNHSPVQSGTARSESDPGGEQGKWSDMGRRPSF